MQAGRGIDVHVEGVKTPLDLRTLIEMADQLGFAHPPRGGEQHVRLIGDRPDQPFRLRFPVAEVSRGYDAGDVERVHCSSFSANIADLEQLYKFYNRNSIICLRELRIIFAPFIPFSPQTPAVRHSFMAERAGVGNFVET